MIQTALAGVIGIGIGTAQRRQWRSSTAVGIAVVFAGIPAALITLTIDWLSPGIRELTFAQIRLVWRFVAKVLDGLGLSNLAEAGTKNLNWILDHWWFTVPAIEIISIGLVAAACLRFRDVLVGLTRHAVAPYSGEVAERTGRSEGEIAPIPVSTDDVHLTYPGADREALGGVSCSVGPDEFVAITGDNGSGKSTLVRILAGRLVPTSGSVSRPGRPGYGEETGTAVIFQRPESQVLGVRVRDDLWWGIPLEDREPPGPILEQVGLQGLEDRETSTLSGGQLQRLAIAAALARSPRLLISDESTAMIDSDGRSELVALLRRLADDGTTVVHVTHRREEAAKADRTLRLAHGHVVDPAGSSGENRAPSTVQRFSQPSSRGPIRATLRRVGHVYSLDTPWEHKPSRESISISTRERGSSSPVPTARGRRLSRGS